MDYYAKIQMNRILKSLLLPAVALLASCASLKTGTDSFIKNEYALDSVHVKGTVKKFHDTDRGAYVGYLKDMCEYDKIFFEPDEQGYFSFTVPVYNATLLDLYIGGRKFKMLANGGDTIQVVCDGASVTFDGDNAPINNELARYETFITGWEVESRALRLHPINDTMEPQEHLRRCREFYNGSVATLDSLLSGTTPLKRQIYPLMRGYITSLALYYSTLYCCNNTPEPPTAEYFAFIDEMWKASQPPYTLWIDRYVDIDQHMQVENLYPYMPWTPTPLYLIAEELRCRGLIDVPAERSMAFRRAWTARAGALAKKSNGATEEQAETFLAPYQEDLAFTDSIVEVHKLESLVEQQPDSVMNLMLTLSFRLNCEFTDAYPIPKSEKDFINASYIMYYLDNTSGMPCPDGWNVVKENIENRFFIELIEKRMEHYRRISEEKLAVNRPEVGEISETDSLLNAILAPHKGKVIYIDVWGTWCGACKEEMKHAPAIKEALKGKDVVFLYFAYSSDEVSWKNVIKENNITGDNVYHYNLPMEQQQLLNELWNVTAYPTYILYDKEGRLVTTDAQSPSSREGLLLQIDSLLKK